MNRARDELVVCVVGAGPRGTSVTERLIASAPSLLGGRKLRIEVIDPYPPGGGRIWPPDQPDHLLMNTLAAQATLFTDETTGCAGPVVMGPSLFDWATARGVTLEPWSHPSRALLGQYYAWVFARAVEQAPEQVTVSVRRTKAVAIRDRKVLLEDGPAIDADAVILTTGHSDLMPNVRQRALEDFAETAGLEYLPAAHPLDLDLADDRVRPGETVLVQGFGMNFFDLMSLLTIGRGGRFTTDGGYRPSGREPVLAVGSRRGVPYRAKPVYGALPPVWPPRHFTADVKLDEPADFRRDIWPLIARDAAEAHLAAGGDGQLDFAALDRPLEGRTFTDAAELRHWMLDYLRADLAEARSGKASPVKAAAASIGASRFRLQRLIARGGLTKESVRRDVAGWFRGFAAGLASGPPASRIAELLALADAGLVRFAGPDMTIEADGDMFRSGGIRARVAIEARLPETDVSRTADPLISDLIATGQGRADGGSLDVSPSPYRVVRADGQQNRAIFALGIPLEGKFFLTALGPAPRAGSVFLAETDAVARAALLT